MSPPKVSSPAGFEIWELLDVGASYPECDRRELVGHYTTREGVIANARRLLWQGRSIEILIVPEGGWRQAAIERARGECPPRRPQIEDLTPVASRGAD